MERTVKKHGLLFGAALGIWATLALVVSFGVIAGAGAAATPAAPTATSPPTITGTAQEGQKLTGNRGTWSGSPNEYNDTWMRCDKTGGSCAVIGGGGGDSYTVTSADVGNTLRFQVGAKNAAGRTFASSVPTALITAAATPVPTPTPTPTVASGCPAAGSSAIQIADVSSPARLLVDGQQVSPSVFQGGSQQLIVRYHVSACGGRSVQGAQVYATAVPFNQFSIPATQTTGANGWAQIDFTTLGGFPASSKQGLIAIFVRASKSGEDVLGGVSSRRLFSIPVHLNG